MALTETISPDPIIRAAILRFASDGFDAPLRTIAKDAGVSAALLIKRFGSKDQLREICDEVVLTGIRRIKQQNIRAATTGDLLSALTSSHENGPLLGYIMQSILSGGSLGRTFIEHMIDDAVAYMGDAVEQGLAHPSRDERARIHYLVYSALGTFIVTMLMDPTRGASDTSDFLRRVQQEITPPMLEVYTQGVFADRRMLDEYLLYISDPPVDETPSSNQGTFAGHAPACENNTNLISTEGESSDESN